MAHYELRRHHSEICRILDASDASLESLAVSLYSDGIIDESTKHSVMRTKGIRGADELMSAVTKVVEKDPSKYLGTVLDIMEKVKVLENVSQSMRESASSTGTGLGEEEEIMSSSEATSPVVYKSVDELFSEAVNLRDKFLELLEKLNEFLDSVNNDRLKLRLNWHLTCERENTRKVKKMLTKIEDFDTPKKVLNCLIHSNLIGYLNYRLLDVFQGLIDDKEVDEMITKYEEAHEIFLKSSDLETLAQLFLDHPTLAPETFAGLPQFIVHLDKEWEKKSAYQWKQLLKTRFNQWPPHIHIVMITKSFGNMEKPDYSFYLERATAKGTVTTKQSSLGLFGAAGTGKTSILRLLKGQEPVYDHDSTAVLNPTGYCILNGDDNNPPAAKYINNTDLINQSSRRSAVEKLPGNKFQWNSSDEDEDLQFRMHHIRPHHQTVPPFKRGLLISASSECNEWGFVTERILLERLHACVTLQKEGNSATSLAEPDRQCSSSELGFAIREDGTKTYSVVAADVHDDHDLPQSVEDLSISAHSSNVQIPKSCRKLFKKILKFVNANKLKNLGTTHFVSVSDTGGQAAFLDIAPAFIQYNSVNLVLLKLDENLEDPAQFFYSVKGVKVGNEKRSITTRNLVYSLVSSKSKIQKPRIKGTKIVKEHQKPKFMILGTHLDKYRKQIKMKDVAYQRKEVKNETLQCDLAAFDDCLCQNSPKKVMYCLDTRARDEQTQLLASKIRELVMDNYVEVEIPVSWFILQLALNAIKSSDENEGMIDRSILIEIGNENNIPIEEVKAALHYFHDLQLCLYYPSVVPKVIFTNPQYLFDKISQIIDVALDESMLFGTTRDEILNLTRLGKFNERFLESICKGFKENVFTLHDFLKLMCHLFIVSSLPDTDEYFMPCVLADHPNPCEDFMSSSLSIEPLLFVWDNSVPNGLFPSLTTSIQAREGINNVSFNMSQSETVKQYRNRITLDCYNLGCKVVLVECYSFIGVMVRSSCLKEISDRCLKIRIAMLSCMKNIVERFKWLPLLAFPKEAFVCKISPQCISQDAVHFCWPNVSNTMMSCVLDSSLGMSQEPSHSLWWGKSKFSLSHSEQLTSLNLFHLLQNKCSDWDKIGRELGISLDFRSSLKHDCSLTDDKARLERILDQWLQISNSIPTWLDFITILTDRLGFHDIARHVQTQASFAKPFPTELN